MVCRRERSSMRRVLTACELLQLPLVRRCILMQIFERVRVRAIFARVDINKVEKSLTRECLLQLLGFLYTSVRKVC